MLRYGIDHHRERLTDAFVEIAELYLDHHDELQRLWHEGPHTIIHGDAHIGNLFLDHGRVGFLDWGIVNVNTPMRDVSYLMTMAMGIEDRRAHERDLLRFYLDLRQAAGVSEITFDDAWRAHRIHAAYNVTASCQVVTFPDGMSERRRVFADAFLGPRRRPRSTISTCSARSEVLGDERPRLDADLGVFGRAEEPAVRHRLPHVELGLDVRGAQLPVHAHGVGEEQVARARLEERGRELAHVAEQRRQERIGEVVAVRRTARSTRSGG